MHWKKLTVWQKSHQLALEVYRATSSYPKEELYALVNQLRRSATSVPANIVEGQSRNTTKEYVQFLYNARGSMEETRYYLLLSRELDYLSPSRHEDLEAGYEEVSKMLNRLISTMKSRP